ncbi:MAG: AAA family ATPase [Sterolibacterium sp.]
MLFTVIPRQTSTRTIRELAAINACFLVRDNWDDYHYKTTFLLVYFDAEGTRHDVGNVKIMRREMEYGYVEIEDPFVRFGAEFCSLGQDQEYYENLLQLEEDARVEILTALKDAIWDNDIFVSFNRTEPFETSLTRSITSRELKKFREIAHEQAELTPFHFAYAFPNDGGQVIEFEVEPNTVPPSNIHVIIGRNGVGKTRLLRSIRRLLCDGNRRSYGTLTFFSDDQETSGNEGFANLITVAFSAFDEFDLPSSNEGTKTGIKYEYIGLRKPVKGKEGRGAWRNKTANELKGDFVESTLKCLRSSRRPRWRDAMRVLETDPIFAALRLEELADAPQEEFEEAAASLFDAASSGHKIVLLTMTRLVEDVSERTLVLIDEPESHLHPPLAASFIRALSNLLAHRNGVAILATHSPVIVQEVPRSCVSLILRVGDDIEVSRPDIETFAENLGLLTRQIFRLEVTESGHHALILEVVRTANSIDEVLDAFGGNLGAEGRSIARALWRDR